MATTKTVRVDGRYMLISHDILARTLHIASYSSQQIAIQEAAQLHLTEDTTINTTQLNGGLYRASYNSMLEPIRVTTIIYLEMREYIQGIVNAHMRAIYRQ